MTIDDIQEIISSDESRTLELKKTTGELKDGMHAACAFLNTDGGWLIFGIAPQSLNILGQQVTDSTMREISQFLTGLEPADDYKVEYVDIPGRPGNKVVAIHFEGWVWGERPHTYHGCPYYKVESTTKVMPQEMYDERIRAYQPQAYAWEMQAATGLEITDLDENLIRNCARSGSDGGRIPQSAITVSIGEILTKWKLLNAGVPTNGAAVLFSNRFDGYPQMQLRMARFLGTDKREFIDNQRAEGNFFSLLDAGMAFFFKHLNLSGKITDHSLMREERLEVPVEALRESLINSLCHRQWEKFNLTNSLAIYDDRIEIANPGVFPPQITPETIKEPHESYPYNPKIAEVLYKSTFLENWGSGARRIIEACAEQGLEEPSWRWDGGFVIITFRRLKRNVSSQQSKEVDRAGGFNYDPTTTQLRPKYVPTSEQVKQLIETLGDDCLGIRDIMALFNLKSVKRFRENYIRPALAEGAIEQQYPEQSHHPRQKYRLSRVGKEWMDYVEKNKDA